MRPSILHLPNLSGIGKAIAIKDIENVTSHFTRATQH